MVKLQAVRGTYDLGPEKFKSFETLVSQARQKARLYGYKQVATPILETTDLFKRTLGGATDVVSKEMYQLGGHDTDLCLRPEGTAGVARLLMGEGLTQTLPQRFFYTGPMFRRERPQKGRYRQFHQLGVELLGVSGPRGDAEVISLAQDFLKSLGLSDLMLEVNSLGDFQSRQAYRDALVAYFTPYKEDLSEESQRRLEVNPLRLLDTKNQKEQEISQGAPRYTDYLTPESQHFFDQLLEQLTILGIDYHLNPRLVRGLDYYNHSVFEFSTQKLGAQAQVLAGGRYDGLIPMLGGPEVAGVGWAAGIERLMMLLEQPSSSATGVSMVPTTQEAEPEALRVAQKLREQGVVVLDTYEGKLKKRLQKASKDNTHWAILIGEEELKSQQFTLKDLTTGEQSLCSFEEMINRIGTENEF